MDSKQGTRDILNQILGLLEQIRDEDYHRPLELFNGSTVGQHIRHIFDFYHCLLQGHSRGTVDYARRHRDPAIETQTAAARQAFHTILNDLESLSESSTLSVVADYSPEDWDERPVVQSSVGRELMYAYDHAVHHLAMVKMGLKQAFPYVRIPETVGVAPSTLKYWKERR